MSLWEGLPEDILEQILNEVVLLSDFIRFGNVCKTWYKVFLNRKRYRIEQCNNEVPLLLIAIAIYPNESSPIIINKIIVPSNQIFNLFDKRCYDSLSPVIENINPIGTRGWDILVSSYGYVATIVKEKGGIIMDLNNPFTGKTISLPALPDGNIVGNVEMVVLSCNPCIYPDKCVVAYTTEFSLWFVRLGSNKWTKFKAKTQKPVKSIIFHKGQLYALHSDWDLIAIDCFREPNNGDNYGYETCHIVENSKCSKSYRWYLVESNTGELLMIVEMSRDIGSDINDFKVFKLVTTDHDGNKKNTKKGHWDQIRRLCSDEVLFLSDRSNAICSRCRNLQPRSMYFPYGPCSSNAAQRHCYDVGEWSLNEVMQPVGFMKLCLTLENGWLPLWINPTLR